MPNYASVQITRDDLPEEDADAVETGAEMGAFVCDLGGDDY